MNITKDTHIKESKIDNIINADLPDFKFSSFIAEAKKTPNIRRIFGNYIYEGELTLLGGQTNVGKSILGYTIADGISKGTNILGQNNECEAQKVLYYDFELSKQQIKHRMYNYIANNNFLRPDIQDIMNKNNWIFRLELINEHINNYHPKVVIIDNMSMLTDKSTQDADTAHKLMLELKAINYNTGVTIILITHTPKIYEVRPMSIYDIAGSAKLHNIADGALMLGNSSENEDSAYIKLVKTRNGRKTDEVLVCNICDENWLLYEFVKFDDECNHIKSDEKGQRKVENLRQIANNIFNKDELTYTEFCQQYVLLTNKSIENGKKIHNKLKELDIIHKLENEKWELKETA